MNHETGRSNFKLNKRAILLGTVLLLVAVAGLFGWLVGNSNNFTQGKLSDDGAQTSISTDSTATQDINELISFDLPDGWRQSSCEGSRAIYISPAGTTANCDADPSAQVEISIDSGNNKDCNQLQNVSDVKKHVCISLYINGLKSLKSSTEYLASSSYNKETTVNAYYVDTGNGIAKLEYVFNGESLFQAGFDQLANSVNTKN